MSRLYYKPTVATAMVGATPTAPTSVTKDYLEKISKIIPSEIIVAYLAMTAAVQQIGPGSQQTAYYVVFAIGTIATGFYINYQALKDQPKAARIIMSVIAFIIWAYSTTGETVFHAFYSAGWASIALIAFSLISAIVPLD